MSERHEDAARQRRTLVGDQARMVDLVINGDDEAVGRWPGDPVINRGRNSASATTTTSRAQSLSARRRDTRGG